MILMLLLNPKAILITRNENTTVAVSHNITEEEFTDIMDSDWEDMNDED